MRYLSLAEVLNLHASILTTTGGGAGIRDMGRLEAAVSLPRQTFAGQDLYPDLISKAAALGFTIICNHPFVDGNKRVGHAAMETFLILNGLQIIASVDDQETLILGIASGGTTRNELHDWLVNHTARRT
jgi:death-on-curing protein